LSLALDSFDVSLAPDEPAALTRTAWSAAEPAQWSLQDLSDSTRCYVAAIAMRSENRRIITRDVPGDFAVRPTTEEGVT